jgi:hypothetical protein
VKRRDFFTLLGGAAAAWALATRAQQLKVAQIGVQGSTCLGFFSNAPTR